MRVGIRPLPGRHVLLRRRVMAAAPPRIARPASFPDVQPPGPRRRGGTGDGLEWSSGSTPAGQRGRVRQLCAGGMLLAGAICTAGLVAVAVRSRPPVPATMRVVGASHVVEGVQTSVVHGDRLTLRVSADRVVLTRPRAFGPFRVGFLRAVSAQHLTIETWEAPDGRPWSALPSPDVPSLGAVLSPVRGSRIVQASAERVRFIRHRGDVEVGALEAQACEMTGWSGVVCRHGALRSGGNSVRFRDATFDGKRWVLDGREARRP